MGAHSDAPLRLEEHELHQTFFLLKYSKLTSPLLVIVLPISGLWCPHLILYYTVQNHKTQMQLKPSLNCLVKLKITSSLNYIFWNPGHKVFVLLVLTAAANTWFHSCGKWDTPKSHMQKTKISPGVQEAGPGAERKPHMIVNCSDLQCPRVPMLTCSELGGGHNRWNKSYLMTFYPIATGFRFDFSLSFFPSLSCLECICHLGHWKMNFFLCL